MTLAGRRQQSDCDRPTRIVSLAITSLRPIRSPIVCIICAALLLVACGGGGGGGDGQNGTGAPAPAPDEPPAPTDLNGELRGRVYFVGSANYLSLDLASGIVRAIRPGSRLSPSADGTAFVDVNFESAVVGDDLSELTLLNAQGRTTARFTSTDSFLGTPKLSPDGSLIAVALGTSDALHLIERDGGELRGFFDGATDWDWGPDGRLFFGSGDDILVAEGDYTSAQRIASFPGDMPRNLSVSPDGTRIALSLGDFRALKNHVYIVNTDGSGLRQLTDSDSNEDAPAWSPDGRHILVRQGVDTSLVVTFCPELWVVPSDVETVNLSADDPSPAAKVLQRADGETRDVCAFGPPEWRGTPEPALPSNPGSPPDGARLNADLTGRLFLKGAAGIAYLQLSDGLQTPVPTVDDTDSRPFASPAGTEIAYITAESGGSHINIQALNGTINARIRAPGYFGGTPRISPDGALVAVELSSLELGDPGGEDVVRVFDRNGAIVARFPSRDEWSWLPDGRLALADRDTIYLTDIGLQQQSEIVRLRDDIADLAVSPDGESLAFVMAGHVWTADINGGNLKQLTVSRDSERAPAWSPDGRYVAVINEGTCPVQVVSAEGERVLIAEPGASPNAIGLRTREDDGDVRDACARSELSWRDSK